MTWDMGDGSGPIVCDGPGKAYDESIKSKFRRTECYHVDQYYGQYETSATVTN